MDLASCHFSGTWHFEVACTFLKNVCTPAIGKVQDLMLHNVNLRLEKFTIKLQLAESGEYYTPTVLQTVGYPVILVARFRVYTIPFDGHSNSYAVSFTPGRFSMISKE
jgi:hypothetical protein